MNAHPSKRNLLAAVLISGLIWVPAVAMADDEAVEAPIRIERVSLFKNGLGFFQAGAELPKRATTVELGQLPIPVHGTFWVAYPESLDVRGLYTAMEARTSDRAVTSGLELLQANLGRTVRVLTGPDDEDVFEGTILSVSQPTPRAAPNPYVMGGTSTPTSSQTQSYPAQFVLLDTGSGVVALAANVIRQVEFPGAATGELGTSLPAADEIPSLRLELDAPSRGQTVGVSFLASGITWAPSYRIDLSDPETARFTAKAVVINEVADLDGVKLDLVTGFPNVAFSGVRSPMAMSQTLQQFLSQLGNPRGGLPSGGALGQQAVMFNRAADEISFPMPVVDYGEPQSGSASEDLFFYPVDEVRLARGEIATLSLFSADMPYEHVYTWRVTDQLDENERYRSNEKEDSAEEVWHSCRLVNTLDMPLTTAPAQFVTDGRLTGQDTAYYTAPGARTTIRINRALNVAAEELELERSREEDAKEIRGYRYDEVEIGGELKITNRTARAIRVEVTKELTGDVIETAPAASAARPLSRGLKAVNPRQELVWEIDLAPGGSRTLTYAYRVYIR